MNRFVYRVIEGKYTIYELTHTMLVDAHLTST